MREYGKVIELWLQVLTTEVYNGSENKLILDFHLNFKDGVLVQNRQLYLINEDVVNLFNSTLAVIRLGWS